jgi:hypothetical protein
MEHRLQHPMKMCQRMHPRKAGAVSEEEGEGAESRAEHVDEWEGAMMQGDKVVLVGPASDYAIDEDLYTGPTYAPSELFGSE